MAENKDQHWIETVVMAGLNRLREDQDGNKLETFGDLYKEHDRVMDLIKEEYKAL